MDIKQECRQAANDYYVAAGAETESEPLVCGVLRRAAAEIERWEAKGDRVRRLALDARGIVSLDKKERALNAIYDLLAGEAHP